MTTDKTQQEGSSKENPAEMLSGFDAQFQKSREQRVMEQFFFYPARNTYYARNKQGNWIPTQESYVRRKLKQLGFSNDKILGTQISEIEREFIRIVEENAVQYAGSLAGYKIGVYEIPQRILVTDSPVYISPVEGDCKNLEYLLSQILQDENNQLQYFYAWLKVAIENLYQQKYSCGQALIIAGPAGSGKSLIQSIITACLGGRSAKPYSFISGKTDFNSELFSAEHLMIEDESPDARFHTRKVIGNSIKQITVNRTQRFHAKGCDALTLSPIWRLSITLNNEPEDLQVLPPLDSGIEDKMMLFLAYKREWELPQECLESREELWSLIEKDLPGFIYFLMNKFTIPEELKSRRFGVKHFHHPTLLMSLNNLSPERQLLDYIDRYLWHKLPSTFTASEIEELITGSIPSQKAASLFSFPQACGTYLARLAHSMPHRVQKARSSQQRLWRILAEDDSAETEKSASQASSFEKVTPMTPKKESGEKNVSFL